MGFLVSRVKIPPKWDDRCLRSYFYSHSLRSQFGQSAPPQRSQKWPRGPGGAMEDESGLVARIAALQKEVRTKKTFLTASLSLSLYIYIYIYIYIHTC